MNSTAMKTTKTMKTLKYFGVVLPLLTLGAGAFAQVTPAEPATASAPAPSIPASPLPAKKTIQATGLFSVWNSKEKTAKPFFAVTVTVDGPNKYRVEAQPLATTAKNVKPSFYFSDGVKQYEFNSVASETGVYDIADAPKPGQRPMSQLTTMASLDLILKPNAAPRAGVTRTVTDATLNGKKAVVITDKEAARKTADGKEYMPFNRVWIETATGLPLRTLEGAFLNGVEQPNLFFDFDKWTFDQPVAPKTFVWEVPAGAKSREESTPKLLTAGTVAPDFTAYTPDGKPVKLSDYKGKVVVLDFWATWCGPCQSSMPHLDKVYKQVKDKNVVVLAVCVWDDKAAYDKWVVAKKGVYSFPTFFDKAGRGAGDIAKAKYNVSGIPTQYVIDKAGKIAGSTIGYTAGQTFLEDTLAKFGVTVDKTVVAAQ